jgi:hypothetical protein
MGVIVSNPGEEVIIMFEMCSVKFSSTLFVGMWNGGAPGWIYESLADGNWLMASKYAIVPDIMLRTPAGGAGGACRPHQHRHCLSPFARPHVLHPQEGLLR